MHQNRFRLSQTSQLEGDLLLREGEGCSEVKGRGVRGRQGKGRRGKGMKGEWRVPPCVSSNFP